MGVVLRDKALTAEKLVITGADGNKYTTVKRIVHVVGPASYPAGGFPVDLSAYFSRILKVTFLRRYTTATGVTVFGVFANPSEQAPDTYASAKFRCAISVVPNHTHTYDKANTPTGGPSGAPVGLGSDSNHTHNLSFTATASGNTSTVAFGELTTGSNQSANTYAFEVEGVPV